MKRAVVVALILGWISVALAVQITTEVRKRAAALKIQEMWGATLQQVVAAANEAIEADLESADLYLFLGRQYGSAGQSDNASMCFDKALKMPGVSHDLHYVVAIEYAGVEQYVKAAQVMTALEQKLMKDPSADDQAKLKCSRLAKMYQFKALYKENDRQAEQLLEELSEDIDEDIYDSLTDLFVDTGEYYDEETGALLEFLPEDGSYYYDTGYDDYPDTAYKQSPEHQFLMRVADSSPSNPLAFALLHEIEDYYCNELDASRFARQALTNAPAYEEFLGPMFLTALQLDDLQMSYNAYVEYFETNPEPPDLYRKLYDWNTQLVGGELVWDTEYAVEDTCLEAEYETEYLCEPMEVPEAIQQFVDFLAWAADRNPQDRHANWLIAGMYSLYDIYSCREYLPPLSKMSESDRFLMAITYCREHDYTSAGKYLRSMNNYWLLEMGFDPQELAKVYEAENNLSILADLALAYTLINSGHRFYYISDSVLHDPQSYHNRPDNELLAFIQQLRNEAADKNSRYHSIASKEADFWIYKIWGYSYGRTDETKEQLAGLVSDKTTLEYADILLDMGKNEQVKQLLGQYQIDTTTNLVGQLFDIGGLYKGVQQYSEALQFYSLIDYIGNRLSNHNLMDMLVCYSKLGREGEARQILERLDLEDDLSIYLKLRDHPELIGRYSDWIRENLSYNSFTASHLIKTGKYYAAMYYISNKSSWDESAQDLYKTAEALAKYSDWMPVTTEYGILESDTTVVLYHPSTVKATTAGLMMWVMFLEKEEPTSLYETTMIKELFEMKFASGQMRTLQGTRYYKGGDHTSLTPSEGWEYPIPSTFGEDIYEYAKTIRK